MSKASITMTYDEIYRASSILHLRFNAKTEEKQNGQKKIAGKCPWFSKLVEQPVYSSEDGRYYSLLMGREFKPGRFAILLDFDNKVEGDIRNGLELAETLKMDSYNAPKQTTPSGGLHYLFYLDTKQAGQVQGGTTGMVY